MLYRGIILGKGVVIDYRCEIEKKINISISSDSILYKNITIYKKKESLLIIGKDSHIAPYGYFLMDKYDIKIGDNVAMGKNCSLFCVTNSIPDNSTILYKDSYDKGNISIGNNVFIGTNVVILPNSVIGDNVVIGANSMVKGNLENDYLYAGNPVEKIRRVFNV
jgi:acetyltransferase-like isoleucine patch superfamily enzyme